MFTGANRQPYGFAARILTFFGLQKQNKPTLYVCEGDRFAALDDPATRKALSGLSPHLLRDVGVHTERTDHGLGQPVEGEALRKYMW